jgi:hypothetical protein
VKTPKPIATALLIAFVMVIIGSIAIKENGGKAETEPQEVAINKHPEPSEPLSKVQASLQKSKVVAYYFHGTARCVTCRDIESYTKEAIETGFPEAIKTERLEFRAVNVDEPQNEHFVQNYQLSASSVVVARFTNGEQADWKNLQLVWELVPDHDAFMVYVQEEIKSFLITSSTTRRISERHHEPNKSSAASEVFCAIAAL